MLWAAQLPREGGDEGMESSWVKIIEFWLDKTSKSSSLNQAREGPEHCCLLFPTLQRLRSPAVGDRWEKGSANQLLLILTAPGQAVDLELWTQQHWEESWQEPSARKSPRRGEPGYTRSAFIHINNKESRNSPSGHAGVENARSVAENSSGFSLVTAGGENSPGWGGAGGGKDLQEVLVGDWEGRKLPKAAGPWQLHPSWKMGSGEDGARLED